MALLQQILQKFDELKQLAAEGGIQALAFDPTVRIIAGSIICVLMLTLVLMQPIPDVDEPAKAPPPKEREKRGYTRAEVAQHKSEGDLWLIIAHRETAKLQVYDVSGYVEHHPGGDAIFTHAGGDCTEGFRGPQHPPTVEDLVEEYCIGWVEDP